MKYNVKLESFEGPLDLLLHLISNAKINIEDVSITHITEQYLDYLNRMREFDIEIASEFLVMAADLLYIKSRALLPKPAILEEETDPEEELRLRLIEYKKYKKVSKTLMEWEDTHSKVYYKPPEEPLAKDIEEPFPLLEGDPNDLLLSLKKLLEQRLPEKDGVTLYKIGKRVISITQRMRELKNILHDVPECSFFMLIDNNYHRDNIVVTFLALLEMLRVNQIVVYQENQFRDITIRRVM